MIIDRIHKTYNNQVLYIVSTSLLRESHTYSVSQKKLHPTTFVNFLKFCTPIMRSNIRQIAKFYPIISRFYKVMLH